jgi:hypothetical protein
LSFAMTGLNGTVFEIINVGTAKLNEASKEASHLIGRNRQRRLVAAERTSGRAGHVFFQ